MGISGLIPFIKKTCPGVVTTYKSRWASPDLKGKRVAIDGTLMTNRFHFAVPKGPLKGKGGAMGWYNLISEMRAQGVQPIAIWDERGVREWKAPEANKRLASRQLQLARRNHENQRLARLSELRDIVLKIQQVDEVDKQDLIRAWHAKVQEGNPEGIVYGTKPWSRRFVTPTTPDSSSPGESRSNQDGSQQGLKPGEAPVSDFIVGRVIPLMTSFIEVIQKSRESVAQLLPKSTTAFKPKPDDPISALIEQERVLEEYRRELSTASSDTEAIINGKEEDHLVEDGVARDIINSPPEEYESLDERLASVDFFEMYTETPRQKELTLEENEIIKSFLVEQSLDLAFLTSSAIESNEGVSATITEIDDDGIDVDIISRNMDETRVPPETPEKPSPPPMDAMKRLDDLILRAPKVREIHDRALGQPTAQDHLDCKDLLKVMGVPVIDAAIPFEAEGMAATMANAGIVDFVVSEDSDVLAYGAPLIRDASRASQPLSLIAGSEIRKQLSLSPEQYLEFCILLGTDASPRIPAIGPARAIKLISQHHSIDQVLDKHPKLRDRLDDYDTFMRSVANARWIFSEVPPIPDGAMTVGEWDDEKVERFLEERWGIKMVVPPSGGDWDGGYEEEGEEVDGREEVGAWFKGWGEAYPEELPVTETWGEGWDEPPQKR